MTLLTLQLSLASSEDNVPENWAEKCRDWAGLVMELGQTIRDITNEMQPGVVDDQGISGALRWFALRSAGNVQCAIIAPAGEISLDPFAANELVAICRELVTEILGPAGVTRVEIELQQKEEKCVCSCGPSTTRPDGICFLKRRSADLAVRERMLSMEGSVEITALEGRAVTLIAPAGVSIRFTGSTSTDIATSSGNLRDAINSASFWLNRVICRARRRM